MSTPPPDDEPQGYEDYPPEEETHLEGEDDDDPFVRRRGHRRRKGARKMAGTEIGHLNLVPMMDIMTILLVFLVKSFAVEPQSIAINAQLRPPESTVKDPLENATKVTITADAILVEDKPVVRMQDLKVSPGGRQLIPELRVALAEEADYLKALEERGGYPFDGKLLIVAHETTPYSIVTSVLTTAGEARFGEYKLVVMQKADE